MPARRGSNVEPLTSEMVPATTPQGRENQLINLAIDRAEQQIRDGTASAQVISHFLKLGSSRERLEQDRLLSENVLVNAKIDDLANKKDVGEMYKKALGAMQLYTGNGPALDGADEYYDD